MIKILSILLLAVSSYNLGFINGEMTTLQKIRDKKINGYWFVPIKKEVLDKLMEGKDHGKENETN